jgi:hypothetical protein
MPNTPKRSYSGLIIPFGIAVLLIGGYYVYWRGVAQNVEASARAALPEGIAKSVKVTGFPYRLTLEITDLVLAAANGTRFTASSLGVTATPFNPRLWVLDDAQNPTLSLSGGPVRPLLADNLQASLRFKAAGFERLSVTFDALNASGQQGWSLGSGAVHLVTDPKDNDVLAMRADLSAIKIGKPLDGPSAILGQTINKVMIAGPISKAQALTRSTRQWSDAGGVLTIMAGELIWGPISLTDAKGSLTLSSNQKWRGTVTGAGALKPEGISVPALSGPVSLAIDDDKLSMNGLPGINVSNAFGGVE